MLMDVRSKWFVTDVRPVMRANAHASCIKTSDSLFSDLIIRIVHVHRGFVCLQKTDRGRGRACDRATEVQPYSLNDVSKIVSTGQWHSTDAINEICCRWD